MKSKHTLTVHNAAFNEFMTQVDNAKGGIYLPPQIKVLCDFSTLVLTNSSFIDKQLRSRLSGVLYSVQTIQGGRRIDGYSIGTIISITRCGLLYHDILSITG